MDSTNPPNGWPHHRIPKVRIDAHAPPAAQTASEPPPLTGPQRLTVLPTQRSHDDMQRGHRESSGQAALRRPASFQHRANSPPSVSSTPPLHAPQHPQTSGLRLPPLLHRFAGDGFDFRRPAMSTPAASSHHAPADVIDLTSEDDPTLANPSTVPIAPPIQSARASRPPRFAREIIDLSDDTPAQPPPNPPARNAAPSSPEVEFVSSRAIPGRRRTPATAVDLTDAEDDFEFEVLFTDLGTRHGVNRAPPGDGGFRTRSRRNSPVHRRLMHILGERTSVQQHQQHQWRERRDQHDTRPRTSQRAPYIQRLIGRDPDGLLELNAGAAGFLAPGVMNYGAAAFDLGLERESTPTYEAPPKAPPGFTRSPAEGDVITCPNCDADLCAGPEGGEKSQVWVIKACGHVSAPLATSLAIRPICFHRADFDEHDGKVYCGECARNRHASKRKGKEPAGSGSRLPNPFQKCVVRDCGKKCAARTAMVQLFL
ncbi:ring finger domain-containing protein [Diplodia corticola]|uniref:Ring finger domain-containing protein n=1 Tax=Diplodia corticola TaxID=236234 RepID=A0A1J9S8U1_9PEZI|nr:ring finger domain-containing protein [Diplodia corticola]OJD36005.1 ring finger domain-containing protein [Diplodia corticola]